MSDPFGLTRGRPGTAHEVRGPDYRSRGAGADPFGAGPGTLLRRRGTPSMFRAIVRTRADARRLERAGSAGELGELRARELALLAVDLHDGLALDRAGVLRDPAAPDGRRRADRVGRQAVEHDIAAGGAVDRVVARTADQDVVARAAEQRVVAGAADQDVVAVAACGGQQRAGRS